MSRGSLAIVLTLSVLGPLATAADPPTLRSPNRQPIAVVVAPDGRSVHVAHRSGSIAVIDPAEPRVRAEIEVGRALSDLAATPDGRYLLATDEAGHQLIVLRTSDSISSVLTRLDVTPDPVSVCVSATGRRAFVASRWSRRLTIVDLDPDAHDLRPTVARTIDLPFAPRRQIVLEAAGKLVVADAFGGSIAVVDAQSGAVESVRSLKAHNIAGMAWHPDGRHLLLTHQNLHKAARSTSDDIHWGFLVTNSLRRLRIEDLLNPEADPAEGSRVTSLGRPGDGGGDPGGIAVRPDGIAVIALSGVGQAVVGPVDEPVGLRARVGQRPTAVAMAPDGRHAYVANTFDDSLSILDLPDAANIVTLPLGPRPEPPAGIALGERLFYDARLSQEGWMSCHSCHTDGHTNNQVADTLGDESYGAPKRVPSLLGVGETAPFAWNGRVPNLETQVRKSTQTTMRGRGLSEAQVSALADFMRSLAAPPSPSNLNGRRDEDARARGAAVFTKRCDHCHPAQTGYTTTKTYDVGLVDEQGESAFNPPSLRGLSQRDRLLHDGRARSPREVLTRFGHPASTEPLSDRELTDLIAFLDSL